MTERDRAFRRLSAAEALRALYIDFEGAKDQPPVFLGVMRRGRRKGAAPHVQSLILDDAFEFTGEPAMTLRDAVERVVRRAEHSGRRIVSWTEYDLDLVRTLRTSDPLLVARFERQYANALGVAKYWRNKLHDGSKPAVGRLSDYLALIEYTVPSEAAPGDVAATIRDILDRSERGLGPTPRQAERWRGLIEKNRHDCAGMRRVCLVATRELEAAEP